MAFESVTVAAGGNATLPDGTKIGLQTQTTGEDVQILKVADGPKDSTNLLSISGTGAAKVDGSAATQPVSAVALPLPAGAATGAKQDTANTALAAILIDADAMLAKLSSDPATQTTLAAILAKLSADPATQTTLAAILAKLIAAPATEAKQDTGNTSLASILAKLTSDPATQTTLAAILTKLNASLAVTGTFWQATQPVSAATLPLPAGAATESTLGGVLTTSDFDAKAGSLTETAPTTDTASSGLNGRLQRIAQRITSLITALGSPFQAGGSIGNTTFASTQSGTWTVQPGNTANTTAWKVDGSAVTQPVSLATAPTTPVTGTFWQATQPVSGTTTTKAALTASSPTSASVGVTSGSAVASNASRKGLTLQNLSSSTISLAFSGGTAVLNTGVTLPPLGVFVMDEYTYTTGAVFAIAGVAASTLAVQEWT